MNRPENLERDLTAWLADTATPRVPDFTDDILWLTARTRQRPRWSFPEWWLPRRVLTLGRRRLRPLPWRTIGLLAVLALLIVAAVAFYVGSQPRLPPPFGLAANGTRRLRQRWRHLHRRPDHRRARGDRHRAGHRQGTTIVARRDTSGVPAFVGSGRVARGRRREESRGPLDDRPADPARHRFDRLVAGWPFGRRRRDPGRIAGAPHRRCEHWSLDATGDRLRGVGCLLAPAGRTPAHVLRREGARRRPVHGRCGRRHRDRDRTARASRRDDQAVWLDTGRPTRCLHAQRRRVT